MKKAHQTRPCENCPYRKDAPRMHWDRSEFKHLLETEESQLGSLYACHKLGKVDVKQRGVCAGWLLDQKKRGLPSIRLRILLTQDPDVVRAYDEVSDGGHEMFVSVTSMCRANGVRRPTGGFQSSKEEDVRILTKIPGRRYRRLP